MLFEIAETLQNIKNKIKLNVHMVVMLNDEGLVIRIEKIIKSQCFRFERIFTWEEMRNDRGHLINHFAIDVNYRFNDDKLSCH